MNRSLSSLWRCDHRGNVPRFNVWSWKFAARAPRTETSCDQELDSFLQLSLSGFHHLHRGYFISWLHIHYLLVYWSQSVPPFEVIWVLFPILFCLCHPIVPHSLLWGDISHPYCFLFFLTLSSDFFLPLLLCVSSCEHAKNETKLRTSLRLQFLRSRGKQSVFIQHV